MAIDGKVKLKPTHDVKNDVIFEEDDEEWDPDDEDDDDSSDDDSSEDDYTYTSNDSDWSLIWLNKYLLLDICLMVLKSFALLELSFLRN